MIDYICKKIVMRELIESAWEAEIPVGHQGTQ